MPCAYHPWWRLHINLFSHFPPPLASSICPHTAQITIIWLPRIHFSFMCMMKNMPGVMCMRKCTRPLLLYIFPACTWKPDQLIFLSRILLELSGQFKSVLWPLYQVIRGGARVQFKCEYEIYYSWSHLFIRKINFKKKHLLMLYFSAIL